MVLRPVGIVASLDVELLFTNVLVRRTTEVICDTIYNNNHPLLSHPNSNRNLLSKLLLACTTQCPFFHNDFHLYQHQEGVAKGSPLGVTFPNFDMRHLEHTILDAEPPYKPTTYCRYIDDFLIITNSSDNPVKLKQTFEATSVLNFT